MSARPRRPWAALLATTLLNLPAGSLYAFSVFLIPMEREFGVGRAELSFVFGLATLSFTAGMNLAPPLYRRIDLPFLLAGCACVSAAGVGIAAAGSGIVALAAGYGVLFGLGGGVAYIVLQQGVNIMVTTRQGLVNGYIVSLYPAGAMIAAPLFGWSLAAWGLRATLAGLALTVLVCGAASIALSIHAGSPVRVAPKESGGGPVASQPRTFWTLWLVFFLAAAAGLTVMSQAAGMIRAYGGTTALALFATTYITGMIAAARLAGGWLADRFAVRAIMAAAHAFALCGAATLLMAPGPLTSMFTLAMIGMGYGFISGSTAAAVALYWSAEAYGRIASRLYIAWCVAALTLPLVAGHLFDLTGGYATAVTIAACGNTLGILLALTLPRPRPAA